jgi:type IV secretion system protein VirB1
MRYAIVFVWFMLFSGLLWAADAPIAGVSPDLSLLIARCAPTVHPETMAAVISAESRGQQYAIADAGPKNMPWAQRKGLVRSYYLASLEDAVATATGLIASGHTVSLGITQVNDRNLASLGISLRDIFDPCTNVSAGGKILTAFYGEASRQFGSGPKALRAALSAYNSGSWVRGERDGYVNLVLQQRGKTLVLKSEQRLPGVLRVSSVGGRHRTRGMAENKAFAMSSVAFGEVE